MRETIALKYKLGFRLFKLRQQTTDNIVLGFNAGQLATLLEHKVTKASTLRRGKGVREEIIALTGRGRLDV